jgi:outer membrane immunogenic protein
MKEIAFMLGAAALLGVNPALAADMSAPVYTKAPAIAAAVYNWGGFYLGANAGGGSSHSCWNDVHLGGFSSGSDEATL